jgi:hypothetical protein
MGEWERQTVSRDVLSLQLLCPMRSWWSMLEGDGRLWGGWHGMGWEPLGTEVFVLGSVRLCPKQSIYIYIYIHIYNRY